MKEFIELGSIQMSRWKNGDKLRMNDDENEKDDSMEVVLKPDKSYTLRITYPLTKPYNKKFTVGPAGLTKRALVAIIVDSYKEIYETEEKTMTQEPEAAKTGLLNRRRSNGKYGIWGHALHDLELHGVNIENNIIYPAVNS